MSKLRSVNTAIWSDVWFENLSTSEKLLFIYLITNEKTNMLGVYEVSIKKISFETGINVETVQKALKGFESAGKIKYELNRVILFNYIKHQSFNHNMKKSAIDCYNELPNELKIKELPNKLERTEKGFETLTKGFGMVRKDEVEVEVEREVEYKSKCVQKFQPPTYQQVIDYSRERKREDLARSFFEYYKTGNWTDRDGKQVKNWKQKFITWESKNKKPEIENSPYKNMKRV
jgi:hypothetical protein